MQRCGSSIRADLGVSVSVNEALARGLRHRIVSDIEEAEGASDRLMRVAARTCSAPATRKGARRMFKEQTRIYSRVLLVPPSDLVADRYGVWLCWHVDQAGVSGWGEIGLVAQVIDLMTGTARRFALPVQLRGHLIERTFQRLGTTDPAVVLAELRPTMLWSLVLGIVLTTVRAMPEGKGLTEPLPFLLPTPAGVVLGDTMPEWPYLRINTYVGGRRPISAAKARLRAAMLSQVSDLTPEAVERIVCGYFAGLGLQASGGRLGKLHNESAQACFNLMKRVSGVLKEHRHLLLAKAERDDGIKRNELLWRWAELQHRTQCEEVVA